MKCPFCSEALYEKSRYCPWCGELLNPNEKPQSRKNHSKLSTGKTAAVIIALLIMTAVLAMNIGYISNEKQLSETTMLITAAQTENLQTSHEQEATQRVPQESSSVFSETENPITDKENITVYITPTGKKYHYLSSCAGKNAIETKLEKARQSYEPCKKCAG